MKTLENPQIWDTFKLRLEKRDNFVEVKLKRGSKKNL